MIDLVPGARLPERTFGPVTLTDIVRYQGGIVAATRTVPA